MKLKFCCDNHANIHSKKTDTFTFEDIGLTEEEWREKSEEEQYKIVGEWAMEQFDWWFEEVE